MSVALATPALGAVLAAFQAAPPPSPSTSTTRVGGPGWSIELPVDLGLVPGPMPPTELAGTWEAAVGGQLLRQVSVLVNRESAAPLDDCFDAGETAPGSRVQEEASVQVPAGRATWFRAANVDLAPHDLVLVEPAPGTIVSIAGTGIGPGAPIAIARTLEVEDR